METKFASSLFGYDPLAVQRKIALMNDDFRMTLRKLSAELNQVNDEIEELKQKISNLEEELQSCRSFHNEIVEVLSVAHLEATERVYKAMKKAEQMVKEARETVLLRQKEYDHLKRTVRRITEEMQAIARGS